MSDNLTKLHELLGDDECEVRVKGQTFVLRNDVTVAQVQELWSLYNESENLSDVALGMKLSIMAIAITAGVPDDDAFQLMKLAGGPDSELANKALECCGIVTGNKEVSDVDFLSQEQSAED